MKSAMYATKAQLKTGTKPFAIRPLKAADIAQSAEIEREAFPTLFPPTSFHRELKNRMASYLVAWIRDQATNNGRPTSQASGVPKRVHPHTLVDRLLQNARGIWGGPNADLEKGQDFIVGFLGTWYMVDEAHIVSVGVRRGYRGRGIGEMLLIGAIEQAMARRVGVVTLEVRPSNEHAINLYRKYGFNERGVRKGYYADNREDAIIMSTDPIHEPSYLDLFRKLEREHRQRWGLAERKVF